jgi:hypothetical protein
MERLETGDWRLGLTEGEETAGADEAGASVEDETEGCTAPDSFNSRTIASTMALSLAESIKSPNDFPLRTRRALS